MSQIFEGTKENRKRLGQKVKMRMKKNKTAPTGSPDWNVELTENGFDLYKGLWEACEGIGALEKMTAQTSFFKPTETQVTKAKWREFVNSQGGSHEMYNWFLTAATDRGFLQPYGRAVAAEEVVEEVVEEGGDDA